MRRQARFGCPAGQLVNLVGKVIDIADRNRGQPHDRAIATGALGPIARTVRVAGFLEPRQRRISRDTYVEAAAVDRVDAVQQLPSSAGPSRRDSSNPLGDALPNANAMLVSSVHSPEVRLGGPPPR
jgi:hypothetical protein